MNPMSSALKNKMKSPPMIDDPQIHQSMEQAPPAAPGVQPPMPQAPQHGLSPAGQQIPPELLAILLKALAGHGGPLSQLAGAQHGKPAEGSPLEEAGESPAKEKKEDRAPSLKKKPFSKF